jgi:riboflavin biosynthesis pyrimidine reductase
LVDEVLWWVAPRILGTGPLALDALTTPVDVDVSDLEWIGEDVLLRGMTARPPGPSTA